eukprot:TRINITY_DN27603_c0_g1_i1.p1 TRINITY_DN27603_c0_g1~~TRINITY_DN27603_c0_g1_i1.p1  ORF type:complete len:527 (+),score=249.35 TRINITY_DN27603_c0_g1_i1:90-1583(+)
MKAVRAATRGASRVAALTAVRRMATFPSLVINSEGYHPQGKFAEAQADYLVPDTDAVSRLQTLLEETNSGVVAHFYMDPELQGVLGALDYPHIVTSDSLAMADAAVAMAEQGVERIIVMGVDFMSENVRAVLDYKGHTGVEVYRLSDAEIGCTLAASAESKSYNLWLQKARSQGNALHVVYINTSLMTKATAHDIVPTITCTSSNVVRTILQAFTQVPDVTVWYGPDTHMGHNLVSLFTALSKLSDDEIRKVHPAHTQETLKALIPRLEVYPSGTCVVHEMFSTDVVRRLRTEYPDCHHTAHFEVPGEMFQLASEAKLAGRGTVGSTSDILNFIKARIDEAVTREGKQRVRVTLGTEAGMITPIARDVRKKLLDTKRPDVDLEIIFPVSSEAVAQDDSIGTGVVPGVAAGEGCSVSGGCATCKFMKMNDLDGLFDLLEKVHADKKSLRLSAYYPKKYNDQISGRPAAEVGGETILHMRAFQHTSALPEELVNHVQSI